MNRLSKDSDESIPEAMQSNKYLKREMENIHREMNRTYTKMSDDDEYSTQLQQYKLESMTYKQQIEVCQKTIIQLQKTIHSMEKQLEQLYIIWNQRKQNDHRFIHELFHLCLKHSSKSSSSHEDIKLYIQQTFNYLIKRSSHMNLDHYPSYEYCLDILKQYRTLFGIKCFTQIPISLTDFYNKYGELKNFIHSVSSIIGIENQNEKLVIKTLENIVEDSKADQMNRFKRLAKVKYMNEALRKIHCYDNFVPNYHQFIDQIADLLEVSEDDQIIPAIKTLKLLAHTDPQFQWTYTSYE